MKSKPIVFFTLLSLAFFVTGCSENPADGVPAAEVTDSQPETNAEAPADESPSADTVTYRFSEGSKIAFVGSKVTGSHDGGFESFSGTFSLVGDQPGPGPHIIEIDMNSTWSDNEKLTGHLKSPDFFDVEKFPTSTFVLDDVQKAEAENAYTLSGEFTLHGVTRKISFPATVKKGDGDKILLDAEFAINRKDFGIVYPGKPDDLIRDEVVIKLALVADPSTA